MRKHEEVQTIAVDSLGAAWMSVAQQILEQGQPGTYDRLLMVELANVTLDIAAPDPADTLIATYADPERIAWMHANFTDYQRVGALGNADSYATRLYDYAHTGHNQINWVIERLRQDPATRSATITTFQPLTDTSYIPCVSLLDFWLPDGALEQVVYAHSIDFGTKGYANLVELAALQQHIASALQVTVGHLIMTIKSAHIYQTELDYMASILATTGKQIEHTKA